MLISKKTLKTQEQIAEKLETKGWVKDKYGYRISYQGDDYRVKFQDKVLRYEVKRTVGNGWILLKSYFWGKITLEDLKTFGVPSSYANTFEELESKNTETITTEEENTMTTVEEKSNSIFNLGLFEEYTMTVNNMNGRSTISKITINPAGRLTFSVSAVKTMNIDNTSYLKLFYSKTERAIAFRIEKEKSDNTIKLSLTKTKSCMVSIKKFLNTYSVDYTSTRSYELIEQDNTFIADLNKAIIK